MDQIEAYRALILEVLEAVREEFSSPDDPISVTPIKDQEGGHYLLFNNGWQDAKRVYGCFLHIDLTEDGKVWIQHDGTDLVVAQMLLDKGLVRSDLVLGFHHPNKRESMEPEQV